MGALEAPCVVEELENDIDCSEAFGTTYEFGNGSGSGSETAPEIEDAVRVLLCGLGEDCEREGIRRTPHRVAKAFREGTQGYRQKAKEMVEGALFPEAGLNTGADHAAGASGLVVVRDINLFSYCESCLLPFRVLCHVGYVPSRQRVVGLSKVSRVADVFAKRLQEPQRLANEVCSALYNSIKPAGVVVTLQCWHIQIPETFRCSAKDRYPSNLEMQGWDRAVVCSSSGVFKEPDGSFWNDYITLLKFRGIDIEGADIKIHNWCPLRSLDAPTCNGSSTRTSNGKCSSKLGDKGTVMVDAVVSILRMLGEDPCRKELLGTPSRYVQWLMNFNICSFDLKLNGNLQQVNLHRVIGLNAMAPKGIHSELNLAFCSQCEHHLLPFHGVVHIGYFSDQEGKVFERSTLQGMVHFYACKLQVQERLTKQIAESIFSVCSSGVMVVVEANHICMISRGIEKVGSSTATIAVLGQFSNDPAARALFLDTISKAAASGG